MMCRRRRRISSRPRPPAGARSWSRPVEPAGSGISGMSASSGARRRRRGNRNHPMMNELSATRQPTSIATRMPLHERVVGGIEHVGVLGDVVGQRLAGSDQAGDGLGVRVVGDLIDDGSPVGGVRDDRLRGRSGRVVDTTIARMLPMIAKPAVEPSARCELRIPDAMPDRSGGIEPIASLVADGTASPPAAPHEREPEQHHPHCDASLAARIPVPITTAETPTSVGRRAPPRSDDATAEGREDDRRDRHRQHQEARLLRAVGAHVLEVLRDDEQRPVDRRRAWRTPRRSRRRRRDRGRRACPSSGRPGAARRRTNVTSTTAANAKHPRITADPQPS